MLLPKNFKETISSTFYDKEIVIFNNSEIVDSEGGRKKHPGSARETFKGNIRFTNFKEIQLEFGLNYNIDLTITCNTDTNIKIDNIVKYNDIFYLVTDVLPFDSHYLVVCKKWV